MLWSSSALLAALERSRPLRVSLTSPTTTGLAAAQAAANVSEISIRVVVFLA
jgi:hypothetical protein